MKKVKVENNIFVVARNSAKKGKLDYYMQLRIRQSVICLRETFQRSVTAFAEPVFR